MRGATLNRFPHLHHFPLVVGQPSSFVGVNDLKTTLGKLPEQAEDSSRFFERRRYYAQKQDFCLPIWKRCGHPPNKVFLKFR